MNVYSRKFVVVIVFGILVSSACSEAQGQGSKAEIVRSAVETPSSDELIEFTATFEEAVAECMAAEGFEYLPDLMSEQEADSLVAEWSGQYPRIQEERSGQYSYGIWALYESGDLTDEIVGSVNDRSVSQLPPAERNAYDIALHGGCRSVGFDAAGNPAEEYGEEVDAVVGEINERLEASSVLTEAEEDWSRCLADAGYPAFLSPYDIVYDIEDMFYDSGGVAEFPHVATESVDVERPEPEMPHGPDMVLMRTTEADLAAIDRECDQMSGLRAVTADERARITEAVLSELLSE